jgi:MFS family permease
MPRALPARGAARQDRAMQRAIRGGSAENSLFGSPDFMRLWVVGGLANALRWLEVLAASLFTLDATGSELAVAAVAAARSLPLILIGGVAGVLADALDRKWIVVGGMILSAASSSVVVALAVAGALQPWHLFLCSLVSGLVYGTEMSARRRMVGESVAPPLMARAVALDSLTSSASRVAGPLLGGVAYEWLGLFGAFLASALLSLVAAFLAAQVRHRQETRKISVDGVFSDFGEALRVVRAMPVLMAVLGVTVAQNLFGFAYSSLMAPAGETVFGVSAAMVGVLAAAEPAGATLGGLLLAGMGQPPVRPVWLLLGGSATFLAMMAAIPLAPWFWACCALFLAGGFGIAMYSNVQTTIALAEAPMSMRSRVMGLITVAVGTWPIGMLLAGWLADRIGPLWAFGALGASGLVWLAGVAALYLRARKGTAAAAA